VPSTPTAPSWPKPPSHLSSDRYPRRAVGNRSVPSTRPSSSTATQTWKSL
jgi:hypothetical protein